MSFDAFDRVINEFGPSVYRTALIKTGDPDTAQDIYQQVFLLLCEKRPSFKCREQLKVWLIRSAIKLAAAERRRAENTKTEPLCDAHDRHASPEPAFELCDLIGTLPGPLRDVTLLYYIEDMSVPDIARATGLSNSAIKSRLARARKLLKKIYEEELL